MHFGATLRVVRTTTGMSLTALAARVGVSPAYLSRVEHGHDAPPTPDRLRAMAVALGLPPDALASLVDELRPDAAEWLGQSAAGRHLAAELRRRALGPVQLARVADFVRREFPFDVTTQPLAALFTEQRLVLDVSVPSLRDAMDVAAVRLVDRSDLPRLARELAGQVDPPSGSMACAIGGGLCVGHARAPGPVRGALLVLSRALSVDTPDQVAVRAVAVVVGASEGALAEALTRVARLATAGQVERLCRAATSTAALELLG